MNIGFDGKRAANNLTGLGNYSRSLIAHLAKYFPQNQYFIYSPKIKNSLQIKSFTETAGIHLKLPTSKRIFWRSLGVKTQLLKDKIVLYHGLSHELPIGINKTGIPSVVTIHDLIFIRFPQYYGIIDRLIYRLKTKYACKYASKIIAISERTKQDIIELYKVDADKIAVIYQSCDDSFKTPAPDRLKEQVKERYKLPDKYILNVGTIEARKNLLTLIKSLKTINEGYKLVVIGKKTDYFKQIEKEIDLLKLNNRVLFLQNVPFNDLPLIYQLASAFIYPSLYEGFGIPIIEALYSNVPVVAATGSCLEEAGGDGSLYVSPDDHNGLANAVNKILDNPELQTEMRQKGFAYVQKFNNEVISKQIMQLYLETMIPSLPIKNKFR
ncbi:glycosyltransferase family 1 protein [Pedobacter heparinus]|uniref:glycosyltransferase family 4 protein n=1 Tax=Pedobacter heparinus TaxID=984 RepID=UPI00292E57E7|nr:glycosyltransferase family 1 protein [Pedobacter heparinus]